MRSFVRKHPQYALTGGQGRKRLYLYEPSDPVSVTWAKMTVESPSRKHVSRTAAEEAVHEAMSAKSKSEQTKVGIAS